MKAVRFFAYGNASALRYEDTDTPHPADGQGFDPARVYETEIDHLITQRAASREAESSTVYGSVVLVP